jgi:hypothetical protein
MGSTFTCLLIYNEFFVYGSIGDSRIYKKNKNHLEQISKDHSLIQEYRDKFGKNIPEHIGKQGNIITRVIDGRGDTADFYPVSEQYGKLSHNDAFLLCSDGLLLDKAGDKENSIFFRYLLGCKDLEETCKQLISYAYYCGSTDNITIVLVTRGKLKRKKTGIQRFSFPPVSQQNNQTKSSKKRRIFSGKSILALCFLVIVIAVGVLLTFQLIHSKPHEIRGAEDVKVQTDSHSPGNSIKINGFLNSNPSTPVDLSTYMLEWDLPVNRQKSDGYSLNIQVNGKTRQDMAISVSQNSIFLRSLNLHSKDKVRFTLKSKSKSISIENSTLELEIQ